jgi:hypothetical protein
MSAAADFVKERAPRATLIMGSAAFLFDFDYDPRLLDDNYLGADSGKRADVILIEEVYRVNLEGWQTSRAEASSRIAAILDGYSKVYEEGGFEVFFRKDFNPKE